jgi:DNA-binding transcriptional MerR regulator
MPKKSPKPVTPQVAVVQVGRNDEADEARALNHQRLKWGSEFTPAEALTISGVTADMLATWYKRRLLPSHDFPDVTPGHGNRRRYGLKQVIVLAVARILLDAGLPVDAAMALASFRKGGKWAILGGLAQHVHFLLRNHLGFEEPPAYVVDKLKSEEFPLSIIWKERAPKVSKVSITEDFPSSLAWRAHGYVVESGVTAEDVHVKMRKAHIACYLTIDVVILVARLLDLIYKIQDNESESSSKVRKMDK